MADEALRKATAEEALRKAEKLKDENLMAALRRASDSASDNTRFLLPLLQLPQADDKDQGATRQRSNDRKVMCPEMYRAAFSGSAKQVQDLLAVAATGTPPNPPGCFQFIYQAIYYDIHDSPSQSDLRGAN